MSNLELPISVQPTNPIYVEATRGPWTTVAEANANVPEAIRLKGLVVFILADNSEYWWKDGTTDADLVKKGSGGNVDLSNYYTQTQLDALLEDKQDNIVAAKTFYVNGNNAAEGNGSIIDPFMTIDRVLDKIRATGDFTGEQVITDRISIVVQPYSGINYQVSQNMWGNIDWVVEEGGTITNSSSINGDALFDEHTESDDSIHVQIFGLGTFNLSKGFIKTKSNSFVNTTVLSGEKIIQFNKIESDNIIFDIGHSSYAGSIANNKPTTYNFIGKPERSLISSTTTNPIIRYRNTPSRSAFVHLTNIRIHDGSNGNNSTNGVVDIPYALYNNQITNVRITLPNGRTNKKIGFKIGSLCRSIFFRDIICVLSQPRNGFSLIESNITSGGAKDDFYINNCSCSAQLPNGLSDGQPHYLIKNNVSTNLGVVELVNIDSEFSIYGNVTLKSGISFFNKIDNKYRFDNLPGSGNNLELDANGNVVRGTGGGETLTIVFGKSNFVNNNNLISPFGDPNGQLRTYPLPFDCEITDVSVQVQRTNAGETVGCEIKTVASSESGNNADTFGSDGTLIYAPSFVVTGAGTRYQPKKNFNAISGVTASAGSCLIVKAKHTGASTYGLIVVIQVKRI